MFTPTPPPLRRGLATAFLCLAPIAFAPLSLAQAVSITEGVQTHASLSGATVTLSGKSELRLTAANAALSGSVINLTSPDCAVVFTQIRPSAVNANYLSQLRINGATAVSGQNCRVVQHELGTIVLPHSPSFQPLQAFSGPNFTGGSATFSQYTYHNTPAALGALHRDISSFKLKRGYMATFATQPNGAGRSQIYVAQDGDLEIGRLPPEFDNAIAFVRVLPWRWVSKKGSCDVDPAELDAAWFYNWNNNQNSTLDWEYVPIRQQRWWPGYPTDKPDTTHLLGFNEPDNPVEDAYETLGNGSVDTAISVWPELLATGLRVGSPAVTDGGANWLFEFIDKADAAQLRVDYVAIHFYRCGYTATQLYNWLYDIHVRTGYRPIWLTEFNNGANWTSCADPTYEQNATRIAEFIDMMDNAPFIERYSVYSRVEAVRQMTYDGGGLTPAGTVYKNNASPVGYVQRVPRTGSRGVTQLALDADTLDRSGFGNNAVAVGRPAFPAGQKGQAVRLDGTTSYLQLPPDVATSTSFSFAAWVYWDGGAMWQRIFDFGRDTNRYMFLTPNSSAGTLRFAIKNGGSEQIVQSASALPVGQWSHVAVTLSGGTARIYLNGTQVASGAVSITPAQLAADLNYLGKSQFAADPLFAGRLDEVFVADFAFTPTQIAALQNNTPPVFTSAVINGGNATQNTPYTGSVAGTATDADGGDTITYGKVSGPAWLQVAPDGTLSGTPTFNDDGVQEFTLSATDSAGASAFATLTVTLPTVTGNSTWITDSDGLWSDTAKWSGAFPANGPGFTANFSTLNITADRTITVDTSRTIGGLVFGDTSGAQNWTLAADGSTSLRLDSGGLSPTVTVNQNTATLSVPLEGSDGFTKQGNGTLVLDAANPLSGTVNVDVSSTTEAQGVVRAAHPGALASVSNIAIRNNNGGSSTLELHGGRGDIVSPAAVALSARTNSVPAIRNVLGANSLLGLTTLGVGGTTYSLQSDTGTLSLGAVTASASGSRVIVFNGPGNFAITGVMSNGSATEGLGIVKNGAGTLSLTAANTATGNVTVNAGTLSILGSGALYSGAYNPTSVVTVNPNATLELDRWGYGLKHATYRTQALGGLDYNPARLVLNGGRIRYIGGAAGAPQDPAESPYGPGFTIGAAGAILEAAKANDTWTVKNDSRGMGPVTSNAGGSLTLTGVGDGIFDKVLPGAGGLLKNGAGTWTLTMANTYTGLTSISEGTLRINGSTSIGIVSANGSGTLSGTGTIGGPVFLLSGGTLAPGTASIGRLTATGAVTFQPGSFARFRINKAVGTRDSLSVGGALTLNGTLVVTNLAGTLADGDAFDLIDAASTTGAFAAFSLPALPSGLGWDTSQLAVNGVLRVISVDAYSAWAAAQNIPEDQRALDADPDGDGLPNAFEWLFDASPSAPDTAQHYQSALVALSPSDHPDVEPGKTYLTLTARIRKNITGMTLVPQAASSLDQIDSAASSSAVESFLVSDDGEFETRTWFHSTPIEDTPSGRAFIRLKIVAAP